MKKSAFIFLLFVVSIAKSQTVNLESENNHSTIDFFVPILDGITKISGKFNDYRNEIQFNDSSLLKTKIEVRINPASISTGIVGRDEDMKTSDFFDVAKFPEVTFVSDVIIQSGAHYLAKGKCVLHGVTKRNGNPICGNGRKKKLGH